MVDSSSRARNPISIVGAWLTTLAAFAFIAYLIVDALGLLLSPYTSLLALLVLPALFVVGLLLIPFGMWREGRRRSQGKQAWSWPVFDLRTKRTRQVLGAVAALTLVNVAIVTVAAMSVVHYTESTEFCGQVCHEPMKPEFTAHQVPPHANLDCVQCHVSPGARGFVKAKLNGTRQLWGIIIGHYERPIPTPARGMPMAADTCMRCHTPGHPDRDITRVLHTFADDEANTDSPTTLVMQTRAIHWHARAGIRVEYLATDAKRETIPYVRVTDEKGVVTEYLAEGTTAKPAGDLRVMDCMDCHSRVAHTFSTTADRAVTAAMAAGQVSLKLPFAHRELVAAVSTEYPNEAAAKAGIAAQLTKSFGRSDADVQGAIAAAQRIYSLNVFPEMKVTWGTYANHLGHTDTPGCFRCHDESHKAKDGKTIRQDCALCHNIQ